MSVTIQNCGWAVKFQCPRNWDALQATDDPYIRDCGTCLKQVYRCDSDAEVRFHATQGHCVAILVPDISDSEAGDFIGEVSEA